MRISIEIGDTGSIERRAAIRINTNELAAAHLHLAFPEKRNRSGLYMRRHPRGKGDSVCANSPLRSPEEPNKLSIPVHIEEMRRSGTIPSCPKHRMENGETFGLEPAMLAVPVSDLVANLLRPCFHSSGLGEYKLFFFEEEPIDRKSYWCVCFFRKDNDVGRFNLQWVRFNAAKDQALDLSGNNLSNQGLVWAAALVPLVIGGSPLPAVEIAKNDYDLRQILGRQVDDQIQYVYESWFDEWDVRVEEVVSEHEKKGLPFSVFYHSILGLDKSGNIHIRQIEGTLPDLAKSLAREGIVAAGLLDSGGSCALYDLWMGSYLNHGWYFREPRGSILVFELKSKERIPMDKPNSWIRKRGA